MKPGELAAAGGNNERERLAALAPIARARRVSRPEEWLEAACQCLWPADAAVRAMLEAERPKPLDPFPIPVDPLDRQDQARAHLAVLLGWLRRDQDTELKNYD